MVGQKRHTGVVWHDDELFGFSSVQSVCTVLSVDTTNMSCLVPASYQGTTMICTSSWAVLFSLFFILTRHLGETEDAIINLKVKPMKLNLVDVLLKGETLLAFGNFIIEMHSMCHRLMLAAGDSLTHGSYTTLEGNAGSVHPYTIVLSKLLNNASSSSTRSAKVISSGIPGQTASKMGGRLHKISEAKKPTVFIILAGTNDVARHNVAKHIIDDVVKLHKTALESSGGNETYSIAVTIPEFSPMDDVKESLDEKRKQVNGAIRSMVAKCSSRMSLLDLESVFNQSLEANKKYWSPDMVHFSPLGYDQVGAMAYNVLKGFRVDVVGNDRKCQL